MLLALNENIAAVAVGCVTAFLGFSVWLLTPAKEVPPYVPTDKPLCLEECRQRLRKALSDSCPRTDKAYLVIGGGFLGSRIIEMLLLRGEKEVLVMDNSMNCQWAADPRVSYLCGDITRLPDVVLACKGRDTVFMTAAAITFTDKIPFQYEKSYKVNVVGCDNVIKACVACDVANLIQTSTFHVTVPAAGVKGVVKVSESDPYVDKESCTSYYAATKALAEKLVLDAHGSTHENHMTELHTISIRPPGIFGAKDRMVVEMMLDSKEYMFLGFTSLMDWSYVDNVAYAHLLGEAKLGTDLETVGGKPFIVHDEKPYLNNEFRSIIIHYSGVEAKYGPKRLIWLLAYAVEFWQRVLKERFPRLDPPLCYFTYTAIKIMEYDVTVDSDRIRKCLGYTPLFSVEEGIQLAVLEHRDPKGNSIFLS